VKLFIKSIIVVSFSFLACSAYAVENTPFQLSLVNPIQIFPEETSVQGLRINLIYGVNKDVNGIDIGPVNRTTGTTKGLQLGAFPFGGVNMTENLAGLQFGGFFGGVNIASGEVTGLQISGIYAGINNAGNLNGVQIAGILGGINRAENLRGIQISGFLLGINLAKDTKGLQITTLYNQAESMHGLQLGLVNVCKQMTGIQIGLVNIIQESKMPFFPIVNASF